jgi:NADPH2:quinone reductase
MNPFWALRVHEEGNTAFSKLEQITLDDLTPGEVVMEVHYSAINYKDALAVTGKGRILKSFPLIAGIDASGIVISSLDPRFKAGQEILVTGCNTGESFDGGYSEVMRIPADSAVALPPGLNLKEAMVLGTAGFTAALALYRMQQNGQSPEMGPILITGASGGVGSFAVQIFSQAGYTVHAVSGKHEARTYLVGLGAHQVIAPEELDLGSRPLERVRYGGVVDNVGGEMLSKLLSHVQIYGNVASIGLAMGMDVHASVMPFILRGVSLIGISSNNCASELRRQIWQKLANAWRPKSIGEVVTRTVGLKEIPLASEDLLHRKIHGRILVEVRK